MTDKKNKSIHDLHEGLMKQSMKEIADTVGKFNIPIVKNAPPLPDPKAAPPVVTEGGPKEEHSGPDKINEIRNEVAASNPPTILNPESQQKLLEIVNQTNNRFENELKRLVSSDNNRRKQLSQEFKDELMENINKILKHASFQFA